MACVPCRAVLCCAVLCCAMVCGAGAADEPAVQFFAVDRAYMAPDATYSQPHVWAHCYTVIRLNRAYRHIHADEPPRPLYFLHSAQPWNIAPTMQPWHAATCSHSMPSHAIVTALYDRPSAPCPYIHTLAPLPLHTHPRAFALRARCVSGRWISPLSHGGAAGP